jgi:hypothetical protein
VTQHRVLVWARLGAFLPRLLADPDLDNAQERRKKLGAREGACAAVAANNIKPFCRMVRSSYPAPKAEAEHRPFLRVIGRRHTDVVATVRVVSVPLDFLRRDHNPLTVLAPSSEQGRADVLNFSRVAVLHIAAALVRIIRHIPSTIELFVDLHILRRMVVFLSLSRERQAKAQNETNSTKEGHDQPPSKGWMSAIIRTLQWMPTTNCRDNR